MNSMTFYEKYCLEPAEYTKIKITEVPFSVRTTNCLARADVRTVAELLHMKVSDFSSLQGIGAKCIKEVNDYCSELIAGRSIQYSREDRSHTNYTKLFYENREAIAVGDFAFADNQILSEDEKKHLESLRDAFPLITGFVKDCIHAPEKLIPMIRMLHTYSAEQDRKDQFRIELTNAMKNIPAERRRTNAIGYINAYSDLDDVRHVLKQFFSSERARLEDLSIPHTITGEEYRESLRFVRWCSFDLEQDIQLLVDRLFAKWNLQTTVKMRAQNKTLEVTGKALGVTRERVRQIEVKAKKIFFHWYNKTHILSKLAALKNSNPVVMIDDLQEDLGRYAPEIIYLLRTTDGLPYVYDSQLELFVVGDEDLSATIRAYVDALPDVMNKRKIQTVLEEGKESGISVDLLEKAIYETYRLTGDTYHRTRLTLTSMYSMVLDKYYDDGIKVYDDDELLQFRQYVIGEFGNVDLPRNNRALTARITDLAILSGRGVYRPKKSRYIPEELAEKICKYIEENENTIFLMNTLFSVFEEELIAVGVDNKYYLQGILHELFGNKFIFRRDYILKDESITSFRKNVINFIKGFHYPVSKAQIKDKFPGITEIVIAFSVNVPSIVNFFGEYIHGSRLNLYDSDRKYFASTLKRFLQNEEYCHCKKLFDYINCDDPTILKRLFIMYPFGLFSVLEYLFRDEYQFLRPYIAVKNVDVEHPAERLREMIVNSDEIEIAEILEFSRQNHFQIHRILEYLNSYNDTHLLKNNEVLASIGHLGLDAICAAEIEAIILNEITETMPVAQLTCINSFPERSVTWTEWLIYSVINKWSEKLEVGTTSNQFRMSKPVVAPKGFLNVQTVSVAESSGNVVKADDLDDIDNLIAEYIDEEFGDFGEYEF